MAGNSTIKFDPLTRVSGASLVMALSIPKFVKYVRKELGWGFTFNKLAFITKCVGYYYNGCGPVKIRQAFGTSTYATNPEMLAKRVLPYV